MSGDIQPSSSNTPSSSPLDLIKGESSEIIENALHAIKEVEAGDPTSLKDRVKAIEDSRVSSLAESVLNESSELTLKGEKEGYASAGEYVHAELTQALWDKTPSKLSTDKLWISNLVRSSQEEVTGDRIDAVGTEENPGPMRILIDEWIPTIENPNEAEKRGWTTVKGEKEGWPSKVAEWKKTWESFKKEIEKAPVRDLFSPDEKARKEQYQKCASELYEAVEKLPEYEKYYVLDQLLPDLLKVCYTGWNERIDQLRVKAGISKEARSPLEMGIQIARDKRRDIVVYRVLRAALEEMRETTDLSREKDPLKFLSDVHFQKAVKQWANQKYHLGYSAEELGKKEPITDVLAPRLEKVSESVLDKNYTKESLVEDLKTSYKFLSDKGKGHLLEVLVDGYKEALSEGEVPSIWTYESSLKDLYADLENTLENQDLTHLVMELKQLKHHFQGHEIKFPSTISALLPIEIATNELMSSSLPSRLKIKLRTEQDKTNPEFIQTLREGVKEHSELSKLNKLIDNLAISKTEEVEKVQLEKTKANIRIALAGLPDRVLTENGSHLKDKVVDRQGNLSAFGALLWGRAAGILEKSEDSSKKSTLPQEILTGMESLAFKEISGNLLKTLEREPFVYLSLPEDLKKSPDVMALAEKNPGLQYGVSSERYKSWIENPASALQSDPASRNCKKVVLEAVKLDGNLFTYASEELRRDRDFILEVAKLDIRALQYINIELGRDREFVLKLAKLDIRVLEYVGEVFEEDKDFLFELIKQDIKALDYLGGDLLEDIELTSKLIKEDIRVLEYASKELRRDREFVLKLAKQDIRVLEYVGEEFDEDRGFIIELVKQDRSALEYLGEGIWEDRELVLELIKEDIGVLEYAAKELKGDREFILKLAKLDRRALEYASEELRSDLFLRMEAMIFNGQNQRLFALGLCVGVLSLGVWSLFKGEDSIQE